MRRSQRGKIMPKIILHIGSDKCGSKAIQAALESNRRWLAERGVLYPVSGLASGSGHAFLFLGASKRKKAAWEDLRAELDATDCPCVLLSWEGLCFPTMVMVGMADLRTPVSEAKQLYHALKLRRIDTALVELPGSYHNISNRPSQLIAKVLNTVAWFERYRSERMPVFDR